jgi:hypothetical protein
VVRKTVHRQPAIRNWETELQERFTQAGSVKSVIVDGREVRRVGGLNCVGNDRE